MEHTAPIAPKKILIPVTTLVEVDEPTEELKAQMLQSLREAEAEIARGEGRIFTREEFRAFLHDSFEKIRKAK